jgi:hypothetical protein
MIVTPWTTLLSATAAAFTALLFAHAAWRKASDFEVFQGLVQDYRVLPQNLVAVVSRVLIAAEIAVPVALLLPRQGRYGAILAIVLLAAYALAMSINLLRGRHHIRCGCGGAPQTLIWSLVVRNAALAAAAALIVLPPHGDLAWWEMTVALCAGFAGWMIFIVVETVMSNHAYVRTIASGQVR